MYRFETYNLNNVDGTVVVFIVSPFGSHIKASGAKQSLLWVMVRLRRQSRTKAKRSMLM